jgi:mono/diheme cytochrome c family protein
MKKIYLASIALVSIVFAGSGEELFKAKCAACHQVAVKDKNSLIAPPINKVMMHMHKAFDSKEKAVSFIKEYALNPDPKKTNCPSIDVFGVMPSQKGNVNPKEIEEIANYLYDNFPTKAFMQKRMAQKGMRRGMGGFKMMDTNGDGYISKDEFNAFRAKKEGIDISKFKYDYFFKKLDTNGDGKLDKSEMMQFRKMMRGI